MWPFSGNSSGGARRIPTERVISLSSQGMPDIEIIGALKNEGYTPVEVDSAMKQALRGAAGGPPRPSGTPSPLPAREPVPLMEQSRKPINPGPPRPGSLQRPLGHAGEMVPPVPDESPEPFPNAPPPDLPGLGMPPLPGEDGFTPDDKPQSLGAASTLGSAHLSPGAIPTPEIPPSPSSPEARQPEPFETMPGPGEPKPLREPEPLEPIQSLPQHMTRREGIEDKRRQIEELIEGIVEERWSGFMMELENITSQLNSINARISRLEQSSKGNVPGKASGSLKKLEEEMESYNNTVEDISSRMSAMENTIKSAMTPMMQTLRSLSDTVKNIKNSGKSSNDS